MHQKCSRTAQILTFNKNRLDPRETPYCALDGGSTSWLRLVTWQESLMQAKSVNELLNIYNPDNKDWIPD